MKSHGYSIKWYDEQQKKREFVKRRNQIVLINTNLQRIMNRIGSQVEKERYQVEAKQVNRYLSHCDVWNIRYQNNLQDERVAIEQAVFLLSMLHREENSSVHLKMLYEVDLLMRNLAVLDVNLHNEYMRRKRAFVRRQN